MLVSFCSVSVKPLDQIRFSSFTALTAREADVGDPDGAGGAIVGNDAHAFTLVVPGPVAKLRTWSREIHKNALSQPWRVLFESRGNEFITAELL